MFLYLQKHALPFGPGVFDFGDSRLYRRRGEIAAAVDAAEYGQAMLQKGFGVIVSDSDLGLEISGALLVEGGGQIINGVAE